MSLSNVTFTPIGGGHEIGANCYQFTADGHQILLDAGVHPKKDGLEALPEYSLLRRAPDGVIITHGHVDHCGSLPYLMKQFPTVSGYATKPTVQIIDRMLHNSVSVMSTIALEQGIREYPLYTHRDVEFAIRRTYGLPFQHEFALTWECPFRVKFYSSGHVLGGASVLVRTPSHTLFYTGDISMREQELMTGLTPLEESVEVDTLVIESTRGAHHEEDRLDYEGEVARFGDAVRKVILDGGTVLVPAFALGRTQEMLNVIARLQREKRIPSVPVYASGLGRAIYEIYDQYRNYLKPNAVLSPLDRFKRIGDVWERKIVKDLLREPAIIVATSGMMLENTPSSMIAAEMVKEKRHGIFFVGYVDPETLGYKLMNAQVGDSLVFELSGSPVTVKNDNRQRFYFSAHAPREDLCTFIQMVNPKNIVFIHGDMDAIDWMRENCGGNSRRFAPGIGETVVLDT
jgi:Cft2 family RNA processing exonuclease